MSADVPREFTGSVVQEGPCPVPGFLFDISKTGRDTPSRERLTTSAPKSRKCRISSREVKAADMLKGISGTLSLIIFTGRERFPRSPTADYLYTYPPQVSFFVCGSHSIHCFLREISHVTLDKRSFTGTVPCLGADLQLFSHFWPHHVCCGWRNLKYNLPFSEGRQFLWTIVS